MTIGTSREYSYSLGTRADSFPFCIHTRLWIPLHGADEERGRRELPPIFISHLGAVRQERPTVPPLSIAPHDPEKSPDGKRPYENIAVMEILREKDLKMSI